MKSVKQTKLQIYKSSSLLVDLVFNNTNMAQLVKKHIFLTKTKKSQTNTKTAFSKETYRV